MSARLLTFRPELFGYALISSFLSPQNKVSGTTTKKKNPSSSFPMKQNIHTQINKYTHTPPREQKLNCSLSLSFQHKVLQTKILKIMCQWINLRGGVGGGHILIRVMSTFSPLFDFYKETHLQNCLYLYAKFSLEVLF